MILLDQTAQSLSNPPAGGQVPSEIRGFLESLLQDARMTALDPNMREEMINELYVRLDNFLASRIVSQLSPDDADAFIKLNEEAKPRSEIEDFLQGKIQDAPNVFAQAFADFRQLYLGSVAGHRNTPAHTSPTSSPSENQSQLSDSQKGR